MAEGLAMADLTRAWQMLLKGVSEVSNAPTPISAAEMVLIRLAYMADLPSPAEALKRLEEGGGGAGPSSTAPAGGAAPAGAEAPVSAAGSQAGSGGQMPPPVSAEPDAPPQAAAEEGSTVLAFAPQPAEEAHHEQAAAYRQVPPDFESLVALFHAEREPVLATTLKDSVRLVEYRPGRLVINPGERAQPTFAGRLRACLESWTGCDWQVVISGEAGEASLREKELARRERLFQEAQADPAVQSVLEAFPGASLADVRETAETPPPDDPEQADAAAAETDVSEESAS